LNALAYFLGSPAAFLPSLCMRTCASHTAQHSAARAARHKIQRCSGYPCDLADTDGVR
jgi:hypothetical protein